MTARYINLHFTYLLTCIVSEIFDVEHWRVVKSELGAIQDN